MTSHKLTCCGQHVSAIIAMITTGILDNKLTKAVVDTEGLQWFQLKPPLKICTHRIQSKSRWVGDTFFATVLVKGFRRLLSTDKPIFKKQLK